MRMVAGVGLVVAAVTALVCTACGGSSEEAGPRTTTEPAVAVAPSAERERAPALEGETLDGSRLALADFRGRPVLINVWSSW